ncbi:MAG: cystathionine beta-lyase [Bosea sp. (in: a-proteobacteria)]
MTSFKSDTHHVHQPVTGEAPFRSLNVAIERASTIVFEDLDAFEQRGSRLYDGFSYGLYGTPTGRALEEHIAALEGGTRAIITPSGQSAIVVATMACAVAGDQVLLPDTLYGPAKEMAHRILAPLGVEIVIYDPRIDAGIEALITARTKLIWVESPGSATFEVQDIPAIVAIAKTRGILVAADNTWASHLLFRPLDHGVDIAMQALSKHASGHGDLLMGSLAVRDEALFRRLKDTAKLLGYGVSPDDCALCERGLKTMPVRMRHAAATAAKVVAWLKAQPQVLKVLHPAEPDHPGHEVWKRDFSGAAAVFGVVLRPSSRKAQASALAAMTLFQIGASWGGVHSLVAPSDPRKGRQFCDWLLEGPYWRLSIGLEDSDDIIADLGKAMAALDGQQQNASTIGQAAE